MDLTWRGVEEEIARVREIKIEKREGVVRVLGQVTSI